MKDVRIPDGANRFQSVSYPRASMYIE